MKQICPHCGAPMNQDVCEYCQMSADASVVSSVQHKNRKIWMAITIAVVVLVGVICVTVTAALHLRAQLTRPSVTMAQNSSAETSVNKEDALKKMQESGVFSSGTYLVGEEIPAGEYVLISESPNANHQFYAGIYADREEEQEISGDWNEFSTIVQLEEGTYFSFSWSTCYDVMKKDVPNDPTKHPGMFCVGRDIEPGTYTIVPYLDEPYDPHPSYAVYTELGSVAPMTAASGILYDPSNSKLLDGVEVTLEEGQYLDLKECVIAE